MHFTLLLIVCGFGYALARTVRAALLAVALAVSGFWLAAQAVGYQEPGATLTRAERTLCAYSGPVAAASFPLVIGGGALWARRRRKQMPGTLLASASLITGVFLGLSLWGFAPYEDGGGLAVLLATPIAALGAGATAVLLKCLPPEETRYNLVALGLGVLCFSLGSVAATDPDTIRTVSGHSYQGW